MKTTSSSHTPTPWFVAYREDGTPIIDAEYQPHGLVCELAKQYPQDDGVRSLDAEQANAAFIVRACNSHAALVEALEEIQRTADAHPMIRLAHYVENWPKIRAALDAAKGVKP
jgi:hypothetical protein